MEWEKEIECITNTRQNNIYTFINFLPFIYATDFK